MTTHDQILKPLRKERKKEEKKTNSHTKLNIKPVSLFYSVKTFTITEFVKYDERESLQNTCEVKLFVLLCILHGLATNVGYKNNPHSQP